MENGCLFCKIVAREIPSEKVFEDDFAYAFLDIHPVNRGHTLVVPKRHTRDLYDITTKEFGALMERVHLLAPKIKEVVAADGINIGMNNEGAAGQLIFHTHIHIIPRFTDDGFRHWHGTPYKEDELAETAESLRRAIK